MDSRDCQSRGVCRAGAQQNHAADGEHAACDGAELDEITSMHEFPLQYVTRLRPARVTCARPGSGVQSIERRRCRTADTTAQPCKPFIAAIRDDAVSG